MPAPSRTTRMPLRAGAPRGQAIDGDLGSAGPRWSKAAGGLVGSCRCGTPGLPRVASCRLPGCRGEETGKGECGFAAAWASSRAAASHRRGRRGRCHGRSHHLRTGHLACPIIVVAFAADVVMHVSCSSRRSRRTSGRVQHGGESGVTKPRYQSGPQHDYSSHGATAAAALQPRNHSPVPHPR